MVAQLFGLAQGDVKISLLQPFFCAFAIHFGILEVHIQHVINKNAGVFIKSHAKKWCLIRQYLDLIANDP